MKAYIKFGFIISLVFCCNNNALAQSNESLKWFSDSSMQREGRAWPAEAANRFDRLPARSQASVPSKVWEFSHNPAGEMIRFVTNAKKIVIRYTVHEDLAMPHMPATGVSGVDLYAAGTNGQTYWLPGKFQFKDTIEYVYDNIMQLADQMKSLTFQLYLPLYNSPKWLSIGVPEKSGFDVLPARKNPVVVYGTSIVQGGCASRPGLAWTAILGRRLNMPVINLGFSGSGKMEAEVTDIINEIDGRLFILDCMPNLTRGYKYTDEEIEKRYIEAVKKIQTKHPGVPVLLAEHSGGYAANYMDTKRASDYRQSSELVAAIFDKLKKNGVKNIYLITAKEFGFDIESTVDGLHPNDIGMMKYAEAYEKCIGKILGLKPVK
jgi:lysophospholipase L1-like esterase